ncbi:Mu transposase C-terminal domain-containing protein [Vogesella amnigena]|uniref:Mu transposase C-terminal domain-containing protein n=1 Tax=Vogesella amnigena TaxID=1507449 RepID=A0ABV7TYJ8_9NEIS
MLSKEHIAHLFDYLGTPAAGRALVLKARSCAPVREVQSRGGNVITLMSSRKMGCEIATESRHIEFAAAVGHEFDDDVLEYYPQPTELKLELLDIATGEIKNIHHTPDFLVIRSDGIIFEEWKSEAKLARLAEKYPYRYQRGSDGLWYAPQIEQQLAALGIRYRICSDATISRRRVENLLHLADYYCPTCEPCDAEELARLHFALHEHSTLYFHELCSTPFGFQADLLNKAIADQLVAVDLDADSFHDLRRFRVFRDKTVRDFMTRQVSHHGMPGMTNFSLDIAPGTQFVFEQQTLTIMLAGEKELVCRNAVGGTVDLARDWLLDAYEQRRIQLLNPAQQPTLDLCRFDEAQLKQALQRQVILESGGHKRQVSDRTLQRWMSRQQLALANGANEVLALVPRTAARGNRECRLSEQQIALMDDTIAQHWPNHRAISFKACYLLLKNACNEAGIKPPSYPTLIQYIKAAETSQDVRTRHGKRMAYQQSEFVDVLYADTPTHGSRQLQYVHIDHTQLDIELICSETGKPLGRPWFSLAIDATTRRIVAIYLTFDPPSYHSVMMVIRDMVRRHQRLPEFIVVDNGRDFMSEAFESFLQVMGVHLRFRPAGQPRHGAVLERVFGRVHSEYVHNLAGNTKATKNVRMTTGKHLPVNFAEWTLEAMYFGLEYWAFEYYDQELHPVLGMSPREAFAKSVAEKGARLQRKILFNRDFLIATCPPVDRGGVRRVNRQTGVKVNNQLYWHPEFRDPKLAGQKLLVRYDPWDASSVYVRIRDEWLQATCRNLLGLRQLTELERRALTEEYTQRSHITVNDERSTQRLKEFLQTFNPEGALAVAMARQQENKALYGALQMGCITPVMAPRISSLNKGNILTVEATAETRSRHSTVIPALGEAATPDNLPDFDVF